jgi:7SK snRNA methylphosphate capping enzyme
MALASLQSSAPLEADAAVVPAPCDTHAEAEGGGEAAAGEPQAAAEGAGVAEPPRGGGSRKNRPCFRYGNYRGYYGYRVGAELEDHRLLALQPEWFRDRRCLDVGCNEGLVSLTLAVKFRTASFCGVDIDGALVQSAQAKLRRLQRAAAEAAAQLAASPPGEEVPEERASLAAAADALASTRYRRAPRLRRAGRV